MRLWLVTIGEPLPIDEGSPRLYRTGIMSGMAAERGHDVIWFTSDFDHHRKRSRFGRTVSIRCETGFKMILLNGGGYRRNISFSRIRDHRRLAISFRREARRHSIPDVILVSYPDIFLAYEAYHFARECGARVCVDIRDLWPAIFVEAASPYLQWVVRLAVIPLDRMATVVMRGCDQLTGITEGILEWGMKRSRRSRKKSAAVFNMGYPRIKESYETRSDPMLEQIAAARANGCLIVCFFGTMGQQFDFDTIIAAARTVETALFILCGDGENRKRLFKAAEKIDNLFLPGWVDGIAIRSIMELSDIGLAPYRNSRDFQASIPNKPVEYMAGGLAILTCLKGKLSCIVKDHRCGFMYEEGRSESLVNVLVWCSKNRKELELAGVNGKALFEERFEASKIYGSYLDFIGAC